MQKWAWASACKQIRAWAHESEWSKWEREHMKANEASEWVSEGWVRKWVNDNLRWDVEDQSQNCKNRRGSMLNIMKAAGGKSKLFRPTVQHELNNIIGRKGLVCIPTCTLWSRPPHFCWNPVDCLPSLQIKTINKFEIHVKRTREMKAASLNEGSQRYDTQ